jgi:sigma-E factor negative regulatory protein RseC
VIEESGVVVSVRGDMAQVEGQRRSTCGSCAVNGTCGTSLVSRYLGRKRTLLQAYNEIGAGTGDRVVVGLPEGALLEASFVAYLVPLLAMIGGAVGSDYTAALLAPEHAPVLSVLGGVAALAASLCWLGRFSRARSGDDRYRPRILRRVGGESQPVSFGALDGSVRHHVDGA